MKIKIAMKDPDGVYEGIQEAVEEDMKLLNLPPDEIEEIKELRNEKAYEICSKWFKYGEYLNIEVDTEEGTIRVLQVEK
ncbi:MAG: hypothetical protein HC875_20700 [Anaerolineales bacterium]|nr:hypothetical protein [Anaerolineales bacterium]